MADLEPEQLEVATYYRPGTEGTQVGGDWYDVIALGAGRTALVVGDVMGRGVRAAAVMGQLRSAVRAYARLNLAPADVLESLDGVVRDLDPEQIVTCVYAVYDPDDCSISWANTGHLAPILVEPGSPATRLSAGTGPPLGTGPFTLSEQRRVLREGALLAFYTDGLVERRGEDLDAALDLLGGLLDGVEGHVAGVPEALVSSLVPEGPDDDVAILLARVPEVRGAGGSWHVELGTDGALGDGLGAVAPLRKQAAEVLASWDLSGEQVDDAVLVLSELVTNALVHGRAPVDVRLRRIGAELVIEVGDRAAARPRRLRASEEDEHGRGLLLVSALANRWGTRSLGEGKRVWCALPLQRPVALAG